MTDFRRRCSVATHIRAGKAAFCNVPLLLAVSFVILTSWVNAAPPKTIDLGRIPSVRILPGTTDQNYRDPAAVYHDGVFRLFFTVNRPRRGGKSMVSFLGTSTSTDLVNWSEVKILTPEDPLLNYSSPGNIIRFGGEWIICFQTYPIPGDGLTGDGTARLFIMRSKDLENWSEPELLRVKGPDVPREKMGRMIDPYLLEDKDEPGKWWCFYKQNGVSMSHTRDFKTWTYFGRERSGENVCVVIKDGKYLLMHSPRTGMGLKVSDDLKQWKDYIPGTITLGQEKWDWARARLTAGFVLDLTKDPRVGKYVLFFHGSKQEPRHIGACSLGIAWSDDMVHWDWPRQEK